MYPAIRRNDEQTFDDMSEESEKKNFIIKKSVWPLPSQGIVEQVKKNGEFRPHWGTVWFPRMRMMKDIIK